MKVNKKLIESLYIMAQLLFEFYFDCIIALYKMPKICYYNDVNVLIAQQDRAVAS